MFFVSFFLFVYPGGRRPFGCGKSKTPYWGRLAHVYTDSTRSPFGLILYCCGVLVDILAATPHYSTRRWRQRSDETLSHRIYLRMIPYYGGPAMGACLRLPRIPAHVTQQARCNPSCMLLARAFTGGGWLARWHVDRSRAAPCKHAGTRAARSLRQKRARSTLHRARLACDVRGPAVRRGALTPLMA